MLSNSFFCLSRVKAQAELSSGTSVFPFEDRFLLLLRAGFVSQAEAELLASDQYSSDKSLLLLLRIAQGSPSQLEFLLAERFQLSSDAGVVWFARQQLLLLKADYESVIDLGLPLKSQVQISSWHRLSIATAFAWLGRLQEALGQLDLLGKDLSPFILLRHSSRQ